MEASLKASEFKLEYGEKAGELFTDDDVNSLQGRPCLRHMYVGDPVGNWTQSRMFHMVTGMK